MTNIKTELEAAAFRKLQKHLAKRTDVQNIDLMNLAGFCRNCLSRWYSESAGITKLNCQKAKRVKYSMECLFKNGKKNINSRLRWKLITLKIKFLIS